ncbi:MAG: transcriptional regulator [Candidatus Lumbricidophila eiseniae]|uniref:Transcriptional regulator n=1 Tax=Candidatus Lumbricidiphila eiseniae TaxID=1969409 RepID=A0A2A6FUC8_9MICO|nr:MAG: transcriptional regulator [Candidatus Lumbricidophila eiseniae]
MKPELDRIDRALLTALSVNARASGATLAAEVGVAESTVSLRLRRLHSLGIVRGYHLDVELSALGVSLQALIAVRLVKHDRSEIDAFRSAVPHLPGVIGVFHMAGADDYLLHVAAHNSEELRLFVLNHLTGHPAVAHTETNLIFEHAAGDGWQGLVE